MYAEKSPKISRGVVRQQFMKNYGICQAGFKNRQTAFNFGWMPSVSVYIWIGSVTYGIIQHIKPAFHILVI